MKSLKDSINEAKLFEFQLPKKAELKAANECQIDLPRDWGKDFTEYAKKKYKRLKNSGQISRAYPRICALGVNRYGGTPTRGQEPEAHFYVKALSEGTPEESTVISLGLWKGYATISYFANVNDCLKSGEVYEIPEKDYEQFYKLFSVLPDLN